MERGLRFLIAGGVLSLVMHLALTPHLQSTASFGEFATSQIFLWRLGTAILVTFLLLCGLVEIYLRAFDRLRTIGKLALALAFAGTAFVFAHEWGQIFFLREVALVAPQALDALEDQSGFNLFDLETALVLGVFLSGWILLAIALWRSRLVSPRAVIAMLIGYFVAPALTLVLPGLWGLAIGNAIASLGWIFLGLDLAKTDEGRIQLG